MASDVPAPAEPDFFLVVGTTSEPQRVWPVTFSVDHADCVRAVAACKDQAKALYDELRPIWEAIESLDEPMENIYRNGRRYRNRDYENLYVDYIEDKTELETKVDAVVAKHRASMLDVLFPFVAVDSGWLPEVDYIIWPIYGDMRGQIPESKLIVMRAKLHGRDEEDSIYEDKRKG